MPTDPRTPHDQWASRPTAPAPAPQRTPPLAPTVAFHPSDDGDAWHCVFGPFTGAPRATKHAAEADADALTAAMGHGLAIARRATQLRADPDHLDDLTRYSLGPRGGGMAVLRWVVEGRDGAAPRDGADGDGPLSTLRPGDAPTLDRVIAGAGCAIVAGEEGDQ